MNTDIKYENNKEDEDISEINEWEELNSRNELLRGIYASGFEKPSPIQRKAILPLFYNKDIIAQAQSGTGKTACFSIGALQKIDTNNKEPQVIVLSPTRELSIQSKKVIDTIGNLIPGLSTLLMVGGTSTLDSIKEIRITSPQIIVGCPGRIHYMLKRKALSSVGLIPKV